MTIACHLLAIAEYLTKLLFIPYNQTIVNTFWCVAALIQPHACLKRRGLEVSKLEVYKNKTFSHH
jgi:hypothetical protein